MQRLEDCLSVFFVGGRVVGRKRTPKAWAAALVVMRRVNLRLGRVLQAASGRSSAVALCVPMPVCRMVCVHRRHDLYSVHRLTEAMLREQVACWQYAVPCIVHGCNGLQLAAVTTANTKLW